MLDGRFRPSGYFLPTQAVAVLFTAFGSGVPAVTDPVVHTLPTDDRQGTLITTVAEAP